MEDKKKRSVPVYPYPKTSINKFLIYRKHGQWRISPIIPNNITVKKNLLNQNSYRLDLSRTC